MPDVWVCIPSLNQSANTVPEATDLLIRHAKGLVLYTVIQAIDVERPPELKTNKKICPRRLLKKQFFWRNFMKFGQNWWNFMKFGQNLLKFWQNLISFIKKCKKKLGFSKLAGLKELHIFTKKSNYYLFSFYFYFWTFV